MNSAIHHRLLVVDDSEDDRFLLGDILRRAKLENPVDYVTSGPEAIAHLEWCLGGWRPWPTLVLLDIRMPRMDGFEVLAWMHANSVSSGTVVAMMSTSSLRSDIIEAFQLGAHSYVCKTGKPDALINLIKGASKFATPAEAVSLLERTAPSSSPWELWDGRERSVT